MGTLKEVMDNMAMQTEEKGDDPSHPHISEDPSHPHVPSIPGDNTEEDIPGDNAEEQAVFMRKILMTTLIFWKTVL